MIGVQYGGNGTTTFRLPDLRGRSPVGVGQGPGLSNVAQGVMHGAETATLSRFQLPAHSNALTTWRGSRGLVPAVLKTSGLTRQLRSWAILASTSTE
ncbi:phage tail protein [Vreelandella gomseomensis]|uniref:phage tail protein n=1 Tax=Halomonadaceae TaxID=28256 RepID=UPI003BF4B609